MRKRKREKKDRISGFLFLLLSTYTWLGVLIMYDKLDYFEKENTEKKLGTTDRHLSQYSVECT